MSPFVWQSNNTVLFNVIQNSFLWDLIQHRGQVFSIKSSFMYASGKSTLKRGGMILFTPFFFSLARRYRFWDSFEDGRATRQKDGSSRTSTAFKPCLLYFQHNIHERENTTNYHLTELSILFRFLCFMLNGFTVNTGLSMIKLGSASNNNRNIIYYTWYWFRSGAACGIDSMLQAELFMTNIPLL